jgi:hypothetical protein
MLIRFRLMGIPDVYMVATWCTLSRPNAIQSRTIVPAKRTSITVLGVYNRTLMSHFGMTLRIR